MANNAKDYLEYRIKDIKNDIERAERDFDALVNSSNRNYTEIIRQAEKINSLKDELKGMETALDIIGEYWEKQGGF